MRHERLKNGAAVGGIRGKTSGRKHRFDRTIPPNERLRGGCRRAREIAAMRTGRTSPAHDRSPTGSSKLKLPGKSNDPDRQVPPRTIPWTRLDLFTDARINKAELRHPTIHTQRIRQGVFQQKRQRRRVYTAAIVRLRRRPVTKSPLIPTPRPSVHKKVRKE